MQRSASDIFWALLVSGEHSILIDRLDHFDLMSQPHGDGKVVQSSESSHSDDPVDSTMSALGVSAAPPLHASLHSNTKAAAVDNPSQVTDLHHTKKPPRKRKWRKPKDMPKRPLSAYNIFFQNERKKLAGERSAAELDGTPSSSMGFAGLAQNVATKWRSLDSSARAYYEAEAGKDQVRYRQQVDEWKRRKDEKKMDESEDHYSTRSLGTNSVGDPTQGSDSNADSHCRQSVPGSESASTLSLWPSMPQTIESLGTLYDANVDRLDAPQSNFEPLHQQDRSMVENLEPVPINPPHGNDERIATIAETFIAGSSLHQLFTGMEEEELNFLMSLRNLK